METAATILTVILSGLIFYLSSYVVFQHVRAVRAGERRFLPKHVLAMALSYNGLVVSLLTNERDFQIRFWIYTPSLMLGVWGLYVLSCAQRQRSGNNRPNRRVSD